jgi:hypothetical protein
LVTPLADAANNLGLGGVAHDWDTSPHLRIRTLLLCAVELGMGCRSPVYAGDASLWGVFAAKHVVSHARVAVAATEEAAALYEISERWS